MTFTEIQTRAAERLNITSSEGLARIGRYINDRYARLTSSIGLPTSRRTSTTAATVAGNPRVTFTIEKIERIYATTTGQRRVLQEISYDEWRNANVYQNGSGAPERYAIELQGASTVTVVLDPVPSGIETLSVDGLANASTLSGSDVPAFSKDFHDALVFGAMADEYDKLEKPSLSQRYETLYNERVADLRYFLAKSSYLQRKQGESNRTKRWNPHVS